GVRIRLEEWKRYFPNLKGQYEKSAKVDEDNFFRDYSVHAYLERTLNKERLKENTFQGLPYYSNEFFKETSEKDVDKAIDDITRDFKGNKGKYQFYTVTESRIMENNFRYKRNKDFTPRPNQQEAIDNFINAVNKGRTNLLMYAVMRFGKSYTSLCCAKEMNAKFVVVVSAKADVKQEWKENVESIKQFDGYCFLDTNDLAKEDGKISNVLNNNERVVLFLTLQDLQGEDVKEKHIQVFEKEIDLLIVDETHFGARAKELGKILLEQGLTKRQQTSELKAIDEDEIIDDSEQIIKQIKAKVRLHLSGTPYRILMSDEFTKDDIISFCQFSDIYDEYNKWNSDKNNLDKDEWENPYYGFPQMVRFAFNPNESSIKCMEEMKKQGVTYALSKLFETNTLSLTSKEHYKFKNEKEILDLFQIIDGSKDDENVFGFLDYDGIKSGKMCRHIVCVLPYRASCDALEKLLKDNKTLFKNLNEYEIINISGKEGKTHYPDTNYIKAKISDCESEDKKTITLTVNRMLTGSTVKEWDTMIFLKNTTSPQEYDQAIFRLQNQYMKTLISKEGKEIKFNMKPQTLLVDFDLNRMFVMQERKSQIYNVNTKERGNNE
ncbi:MAG: DEAD/DEAH box helicase family protein, partial [Bacteroidota bacterium]|nr:DEAD/DEAH box helicase family protein [Bacteroidota bacterium]